MLRFLVLAAFVLLGSTPLVRADDASEPQPTWGERTHVLYGEHLAMRVDPEVSRAEAQRFPDAVRKARIDRVVSFDASPTRGFILAVGVEGTWACHLDTEGWTTTFNKGLLAVKVRHELDAATAHHNLAMGVKRENRILARDAHGRWWLARDEGPKLSFSLPRRKVHIETPLRGTEAPPPDTNDPTPASTIVVGPRRARLFQVEDKPWQYWIVHDATPGLDPAVGVRVKTEPFKAPEESEPLLLLSVWPKGKDRTSFDALLMTRTEASTDEKPCPRVFHFTRDSGATWASFEATEWKGHPMIGVQRPESVVTELARYPAK